MPAQRPTSTRSAAPAGSPAARCEITSKDNQWLKRFRAALAGQADEPGVVGIEGPHLLEEALRSGVEIQAVLVSPEAQKQLERLGLPWAVAGRSAQEGALPLSPRGPRIFHTTDRLFASAAQTETPQGLAALVRFPEYCFDDLLLGVPLVLVLIGVQDPGNVGTLVRAAEAFGATGLIAAAGTANPLGPKALRASAGSIFRLPTLTRAQPPVLLAQLRVAGAALLATVADKPLPGAPRPQAPWQIDLRGSIAVLIGSEPRGLPESVVKSADLAVCIPLQSPVESLNAAVAASVVLYEAARQRAVYAAGDPPRVSANATGGEARR